MIAGDMLSRDERHQIHNARILEFMAGQISGKEFVFSLTSQCGFHELDAKRQWQDIRDLAFSSADEAAIPAIYKKRCGDMVWCPGLDTWREGKISKFYGNEVGVIVRFSSGLELPFTLFQLRAVE